MQTKATTYRARPAGLDQGWHRAGRILTGGWDILLAWQERAAQRRQLAAMSDRMLRDIGLSRADVAREFAKPFWRL